MGLEIRVIFSVITIFIGIIYCEFSQEAVKNLLQTYSTNINSSIRLSKYDKELLNIWDADFQLHRINITTKFRLQMSRHKEHSFRRSNFNKKWLQCMEVYASDLRASELSYFENESSCLKSLNYEDKDKKKSVDQVEREIKRWRRSYKYLLHLCSINHPEDEDGAEVCLVEYIERDNYNSTLQRLMMMKLDAMSELYFQLKNSMTHLEDCLKKNFSTYLELIRLVMEKLNRCYNGNKKV